MQQFGLHAKRSRRCLVFQININWHEGTVHSVTCLILILNLSIKVWWLQKSLGMFPSGTFFWGVAGKFWFCTCFFYFCSIQWLNMAGWILYTYISKFVHTLYDVTSPCCQFVSHSSLVIGKCFRSRYFRHKFLKAASDESKNRTAATAGCWTTGVERGSPLSAHVPRVLKESKKTPACL